MHASLVSTPLPGAAAPAAGRSYRSAQFSVLRSVRVEKAPRDRERTKKAARFASGGLFDLGDFRRGQALTLVLRANARSDRLRQQGFVFGGLGRSGGRGGRFHHFTLGVRQLGRFVDAAVGVPPAPAAGRTAVGVFALRRLQAVLMPPDPGADLLARIIRAFERHLPVIVPPDELADLQVVLVGAFDLLLTGGIPRSPSAVLFIFALLGVDGDLGGPPIVRGQHDLFRVPVHALGLLLLRAAVVVFGLQGQLAAVLVGILDRLLALSIPFVEFAVDFAGVEINVPHFAAVRKPPGRLAVAIAVGEFEFANFALLAVVDRPLAVELAVFERALRNERRRELLIRGLREQIGLAAAIPAVPRAFALALLEAALGNQRALLVPHLPHAVVDVVALRILSDFAFDLDGPVRISLAND